MRVVPYLQRSVCLALLLAAGAHAASDTFLFGDGHAGDAKVSGTVVVNRFAVLDADVAPGALRMRVSSVVATAGDVVMLWRLQPEVAVGSARSIDLTSAHVGQFELARVSSVEGGELVLTDPVLSAFPLGSQVVFVPEYRDVTISPGASITTPAWNGSTGGIVAMLIAGQLLNDGTVTAKARGFRGPLTVALADCSALDGGAPQGETFIGFGSGYGQDSNFTGGGGGTCLFGGGGGGGHRGAGGRGADALNSSESGGAGGSSVTYELTKQMLFGGGSGAGWNNLDFYRFEAHGTAGGGVVWVRAKAIVGDGTFDASGEGRGAFGNNSPTGVAGGGGGGSVVLRAQTELHCTAARAEGGIGSAANIGATKGNGGGGGGGLSWLQGAQINCPASVAGGLALPSSGENGGDGVQVLTQSGLDGPATPIVTSPAARSTVSLTSLVRGTAAVPSVVQLFIDGLRAGVADTDADGQFAVRASEPMTPGVHFITVSARVDGIESAQTQPLQILAAEGLDGLRFASTPRDAVQCGFAYRYSRTGVPEIEGASSEVTFSLEGDAPAAMIVNASTGALTWVPSDRDARQWQFELVATDASGSVRQPIDVLVECDPKKGLNVGCGCSELGAAPVFVLALMFRRSRRPVT